MNKIKRTGLSKRELSILVFVILSIVGYLFYVGVIAPLENRSKGLEYSIKSKKDELKRIMDTIRESEVMEADYKDIVEDFKQKGSDEEVMSSVLSEIEAVSKTVDITISDMKPSRVKKMDFYNNFAVSLKIKGEIPEIVNFVHTLQKKPHAFNIDEIILSRKSSRQAGVSCKLVIGRILIP